MNAVRQQISVKYMYIKLVIYQTPQFKRFLVETAPITAIKNILLYFKVKESIGTYTELLSNITANNYLQLYSTTRDKGIEAFENCGFSWSTIIWVNMLIIIYLKIKAS